MAGRDATISSRNLDAGNKPAGGLLKGIMKPLADLLIPTKRSKARAAKGGGGIGGALGGAVGQAIGGDTGKAVGTAVGGAVDSYVGSQGNRGGGTAYGTGNDTPSGPQEDGIPDAPLT
jgi:hypothetical protein